MTLNSPNIIITERFVRLDWAMKRLLRNKANFGIIEGLISEIIGQDMKIEVVLESESNRTHADDKQNRADLVVRNEQGEIILIEVQLTREWDYFQRMLYGTTKLIQEYIDKGQEYHHIKKVYSINIVYFELGQGLDYVYHGTTSFSGIHHHDTLALNDKQKEYFKKEEVRHLFPEYFVIKVNQFNDLAKDSLDQWIYFLKNSDIPDNFHAKGIDAARAELNVMRLEPEARKDYENYMDHLRDQASDAYSQRIDMEFEFKKGRAEGLVEGRAEGEQIGAMKAKLETARNLKQAGLSNDMIASAMGLSPDEIQGM